MDEQLKSELPQMTHYWGKHIIMLFKYFNVKASVSKMKLKKQ